MRQQPEANRGGVASLPPGERLFPAGLHRRQERQADAQLAGAHTAVPGSAIDLYKAYDFTEPWDGPKNKKLLARLSRGVCLPERPQRRHAGAAQTSYVAVVGPNAAWAGEKPRKLARFSGKDASNTIMVVEVADSGIAWAEPRDLSLDTLGAADGKSPALVLSSNHGRREEFFFTYDYGSGVNVAMADGSVRLPVDRLVVRPRTCGRSCKSAAARKRRSALMETSTAGAAPELAQHRRPGRVAAFGRHAADVARCGAGKHGWEGASQA